VRSETGEFSILLCEWLIRERGFGLAGARDLRQASHAARAETANAGATGLPQIV